MFVDRQMYAERAEMDFSSPEKQQSVAEKSEKDFLELEGCLLTDKCMLREPKWTTHRRKSSKVLLRSPKRT
ncbi:hypothetical protein, partial [Paenibacillus alginolyticus]